MTTKIGVYLTDDIAAAAAFAGTAIVLAFMLWRTARLLVADWTCELRCPEPWSAVLVGPDDAALIDDRPQAAQLYAPPHADVSLRAAFCAPRWEAPRKAIEPAGEIETRCDRDREPEQVSRTSSSSAAVPIDQPIAPDRVEGRSRHDERGPIRTEVEDARSAWVRVRSLAQTAFAARSKCQLCRDQRFRRLVNARAEDARQDTRPRVRVIGVPIKIVSDIVILGQGKKEPLSSEGSPKANLDGGFTEAQVTASRRIRLRSDPKTTVDEAALAEARRKVIALAEALARQTAREDDAAEQARERSSFSEHVAASGSRMGSDGNDETG